MQGLFLLGSTVMLVTAPLLDFGRFPSGISTFPSRRVSGFPKTLPPVGHHFQLNATAAALFVPPGATVPPPRTLRQRLDSSS